MKINTTKFKEEIYNKIDHSENFNRDEKLIVKKVIGSALKQSSDRATLITSLKTLRTQIVQLVQKDFSKDQRLSIQQFIAEVENDSATKIQAVFRGHLVHKAYSAWKWEQKQARLLHMGNMYRLLLMTPSSRDMYSSTY